METLLAETMLADLRARAARVCWCKRTGCTTRKVHSRAARARKSANVVSANMVSVAPKALVDAVRLELLVVVHGGVELLLGQVQLLLEGGGLGVEGLLNVFAVVFSRWNCPAWCSGGRKPLIAMCLSLQRP